MGSKAKAITIEKHHQMCLEYCMPESESINQHHCGRMFLDRQKKLNYLAITKSVVYIWTFSAKKRGTKCQVLRQQHCDFRLFHCIWNGENLL